jgi:cytochrome c-type biogenesis protein CcmH
MKLLQSAIMAMVVFVNSVNPVLAVNPDEMLFEPTLEARARAISAQLRCLVCRNESIDVSDAELAKDLRVLVRRRLKWGETDKEVITYIVSRYGEFVLLKPQFEAKTLLLWGIPGALLSLGCGLLLVSAWRRKDRSLGNRLTLEEETRLNRILDR